MSQTPPSRDEALIVAAHQELGQTLRSELEADGWQTIVTNSAGPARKLLKRGTVGLLILDEESLPEAAPQLGKLLRSLDGEIPLLIFAQQGGQQVRTSLQNLAPDAILDLPPNADQLRDTLRHIREKRREKGNTSILGRSEAIQQIQETINQIASTPVIVLITGESGTGKDLVAHAIHERSSRRNARFLTVNCGAIPENLLESELFGHEKGAFTDARTQRKGIFEAANGGTVFLDEIGEMSLSAQVRLLRVLEDREVTPLGSNQPIKVDVRVIAATNRNLRQAVENGKFRRDLYYRLRVVEIPAPPLRARPEDIPTLVDHFIRLYSQDHRVPPIQLDAQSLVLLQNYGWPGNVRELKNLIERLMVLSVNRNIGPGDIATHLEDLNGPASLEPEVSTLPIHLGTTPEESHRDLLYFAILEVARDIKELKVFLMANRPEVRSLPVFPTEKTPIVDQGTEVEYTESGAHSPAPDEIKPLREVEREAIIRALKATGGHRKRAAQLLDMPERTLYRKLRQYNL